MRWLIVLCSIAVVLAAGALVIALGEDDDGRAATHGPMMGAREGGGGMGMGGPSGDRGGGGMGMGRGGMGGMMVESEADYLAGMIPHHQEAVDAARVLLRGTDSPRMRRFAADIIRTQSAEIRQMRAWLARWYPGTRPDTDYRPMMRDLSGLSGDALDRAFLQDMIHHHMMAVMMSRQLLARDLVDLAAVRPFAELIRDNQMAEIRMMRSWLRG
jgi:uncharacterized protein (DUF305 family)